MTKAFGTILIVLVCIITFPVTVGILGGIFGVAIGAIFAVLGAAFGVIGAIFGAVFSLFDWLFDWDHSFSFFECNFFTIAAIGIIIALIVRSRNKQRTRGN